MSLTGFLYIYTCCAFVAVFLYVSLSHSLSFCLLHCLSVSLSLSVSVRVSRLLALVISSSLPLSLSLSLSLILFARLTGATPFVSLSRARSRRQPTHLKPRRHVYDLATRSSLARRLPDKKLGPSKTHSSNLRYRNCPSSCSASC